MIKQKILKLNFKKNFIKQKKFNKKIKAIYSSESISSWILSPNLAYKIARNCFSSSSRRVCLFWSCVSRLALISLANNNFSFVSS